MAKLGKYTSSAAPGCSDGTSPGAAAAPIPSPRKRPMPGKRTFTKKEQPHPNGKYGFKS